MGPFFLSGAARSTKLQAHLIEKAHTFSKIRFHPFYETLKSFKYLSICLALAWVFPWNPYLRCGILAHGFLRAQCTSCQHELPVCCQLVADGVSCRTFGSRSSTDQIISIDHKPNLQMPSGGSLRRYILKPIGFCLSLIGWAALKRGTFELTSGPCQGSLCLKWTRGL